MSKTNASVTRNSFIRGLGALIGGFMLLLFTDQAAAGIGIIIGDVALLASTFIYKECTEWKDNKNQQNENK